MTSLSPTPSVPSRIAGGRGSHGVIFSQVP
nr:MAG TPA: hypothetical protein [Caudoviricetes sp.]